MKAKPTPESHNNLVLINLFSGKAKRVRITIEKKTNCQVNNFTNNLLTIDNEIEIDGQLPRHTPSCQLWVASKAWPFHLKNTQNQKFKTNYQKKINSSKFNK